MSLSSFSELLSLFLKYIVVWLTFSSPPNSVMLGFLSFVNHFMSSILMFKCFFHIKMAKMFPFTIKTFVGLLKVQNRQILTKDCLCILLSDCKKITLEVSMNLCQFRSFVSLSFLDLLSQNSAQSLCLTCVDYIPVALY